ncbi:hypothetical protein HPB48_011544 [Haemaphysalis longicornis]|uniref:Uncharacterized protein n=1 Tax=Haemaphysalis longicornis TaxID=44386 RepID=A0A9J6G0S3_HAELO|nr:hypothetical protein HPB48_011544 [Haemaphysalis longicornis]
MSCESAYSGQANEFETVKEDLVKHGVFWPEIRNSSNLIQMLFSLSAVWNWGTILEVQMIRSGHFIIAPTPFYRDTLQRRADMLKNSQNSGRDFYREYFGEMVTEFRRKRSGEVLSYEQLRALEEQVIPKIVGPFKASTFTTIRNKSLGDMLNITGIVPSKVIWENSIQKYFNYTPGFPYVFTVINVEFFRAFFDLIAEVGEPKMAYYIGWAIAQPASLLSEAKLIQYYYITDAKAREGQLRFCSGTTHRYIGLPFYAAYMRDQISPDDIQDTSVLVHRLRKSLVQAMENSPAPWNQLSTAPYTPNETAEAESSEFRLFSDAAEEPLNARYAAFPDMGTSVFSNMERATKGRRLTSESTMMERFRIRHDARVYYPSDQGFVFLPIVFELPLYQNGAPYAVKYGALGGEIADALAGELLRAAKVLTKSKGAEKNLSASCLPEEVRERQTTEGALQLTVKALSLQTLYRTFLAVNDAPLRLRLGPRKLLTEEQVFFAVGCYMQCGSPIAETRCNDLLKSFSGFGRAFGCARIAAMFSDRDCDFT